MSFSNSTELYELYREAASRCVFLGLPIDDKPCGAIHQWVVANCAHRPDTAFFIVLGICCEMADMEAQREGYRDQFDRAANLALEKYGRSQ